MNCATDGSVPHQPWMAIGAGNARSAASGTPASVYCKYSGYHMSTYCNAITKLLAEGGLLRRLIATRNDGMVNSDSQWLGGRISV